MPAPRATGRPAKFCGPACRKAADRRRRAEQRQEAQQLARLDLQMRAAAERQHAAIQLVTLITEDPQAAVSALDRGCRVFQTFELEGLRREIASFRRQQAAQDNRA